MLLPLLLLAACSGDADKSSTDDTGGPATCAGKPVLTVLSPADNSSVAVGERVALEGEAVSSVGEPVVMLWAIDGDVEVIGGVGGWTPSVAGTYELGFQGEDRCGVTQTFLTVRVTGGDTGGDTGGGDTGGGDTGDTGTPAEAGVTRFGGEAGLPVAGWRGLSVGPAGDVWGATTVGLVRLDPTTATSTTYGAAAGLLSDAPTAVLAASDGTVWVGHIGDPTRQGEQVSRAEDGTLTVLRAIDYAESEEILAVVRLFESGVGDGDGDIWMGTNEGLCVWDANLDRFAEHAHPTHPHGYSEGVAVSDEGDIWNGDAYQLSRWRYSNDGDLSPSADLYETVPTWPIELEDPVEIADADAYGGELWVTSELFGVARVVIGENAGTSDVSLFSEPASARAVRADGAGNVWIGTTTGLWRWDGATLAEVTADWIPADGVQEIAVDRRTAPPTLWFGTSGGLVRLVGEPG